MPWCSTDHKQSDGAFFFLFFFLHKVTTATSQRVSFSENKTLLLDYTKILKKRLLALIYSLYHGVLRFLGPDWPHRNADIRGSRTAARSAYQTLTVCKKWTTSEKHEAKTASLPPSGRLLYGSWFLRLSYFSVSFLHACVCWFVILSEQFVLSLCNGGTSSSLQLGVLWPTVPPHSTKTTALTLQENNAQLDIWLYFCPLRGHGDASSISD